jgi:hypothetical protein
LRESSSPRTDDDGVRDLRRAHVLAIESNPVPLSSWRPLGQPEHHGDILIGGISPRDGGMNVGKIEMAERLIFSILELEEQGHQSRSEVMDNAYPTNGLLLARIVRHLAGWMATVR